MTRSATGRREPLLFRDGRLTVLGDDGFEGTHGSEKRALQLADLAAVDDQIALARQRDDLLLDMRFMKMRAGHASFGIDARGRDEGHVDAETGQHVEIVSAGEGSGGWVIDPAEHDDGGIRLAGQPIGDIQRIADCGDGALVRYQIDEMRERRATVDEDGFVSTDMRGCMNA